MTNILCLPDLHAPAFNYDAVKWAASIRKQYNCDLVVQLGDLSDQRAWSRFPQDPDFTNPEKELEELLDSLKFVHKHFPEMYIVEGNHCSRWMRKALQNGIPRVLIKSLNEMLPYKGWKWHFGPSPLKKEGIYFIHGDEMTGTVALKASRLGGKLVTGHSHAGRLEFVPMFDKFIWGMECGCLIDEDSSAFKYAAKNPRRCFRGVGVIVDGSPLLIPYPG